MSNQITTAFVEQYSRNVSMLSQQMGSKLRGSVDVENVTGKNAFFDQVGVTAAVLRTSRHGDTPQIDTPHSRRRLSLADYEWADLVDDMDKVRMLVDPTSSYAKAAAAAMNRSIDDVIIASMNATAQNWCFWWNWGSFTFNAKNCNFRSIRWFDYCKTFVCEENPR